MTDLTTQVAADLATLEKAGCIRSRWLAGMLTTPWDDDKDGAPVRMVTRGWGIVVTQPEAGAVYPSAGEAPALTDPVTVQALLLLLREAKGPDIIEAGHHCDGGYWLTVQDRTWTGAALADCVAAALHAVAEGVDHD